VKIHLSTYPPGIHRIIESLPPETLNLQRENFAAAVDATVVLDRHDPYLQMEFNLTTVITLDCDRCLEPFAQTLNVRAPMMYVLGRTSSVVDADDPGITYLPAGTMDLDLTTDIRDFLILAVPDKRLCREDCKGICPGCGVDLNMQSCTCGRSL
jgi:uncharacterized protein